MKNQEKIAIFALVLCLGTLLAACGNKGKVGTTPPPPTETGSVPVEAVGDGDSIVASESHGGSETEKHVDVVAKELFEKAAAEIILLSSEDPRDVLQEVLGDPMDMVDKEITIDGNEYQGSTLPYARIEKYYGEIFADEALDWIVSTKFANVDGMLYYSRAGGASGWGIADTEVQCVEQSEETYTYAVTFYRVEMADQRDLTTSQFTMKKTENGYRVVRIDYIPDLLKK